MKHFENNVNDGMSRTDSIETLIDLTSCIAVNALIVAGGRGQREGRGRLVGHDRPGRGRA